MRSGNGAFIEELINRFEAESLKIPIRGISDLNPDQNLAIINGLIAGEQ